MLRSKEPGAERAVSAEDQGSREWGESSPAKTVPGNMVPRSGLFSLFPGESKTNLAGGEKPGFLALRAGDAGSNPAGRFRAGAAQMEMHHPFPGRMFPGR
jgi:hypothetical protein